MMILPDSDPPTPARTWVRGTCPACGSAEVLHRIIGMPLAEACESSPPWVIWAGCVVVGLPDRECTACGHSWDIEEDEESD